MKNQILKPHWLIASLFTVVIVLDLSTPADYVFGYCYTGAILLANSQLSRLATIRVTIMASVLTLLNLFLPGGEIIHTAAIANRLIVVFALIVTGWLSERNYRYQEAIATQQAQLQSQQQLASMREDFISTLTHDLKTPLIGAIETLKSFQTGQFGNVTSAQQKVLQMMERSHRTTLQLVETVLDIYRNDISGLKLQCQVVNLAAIAFEVIATLRDLAATRRVYIDLSYGESDFRRSLWVNGDELQLQRVFTNLLTNAVNHSPRGGRVEVLLESYSVYHIVKFLDTGQGITEEELPHLFERFYQGNSDRQAKGSGLGLYLSRQIITAHGGTIWAENRSPKGALFAFRLLASPPPLLENN
ncbi:MAG TPA: HAMP domain-containing sensor histidine kinase [Oculatellaceae cyanobacterium]|jgi:two-component system NarL family sensor kinase